MSTIVDGPYGLKIECIDFFTERVANSELLEELVDSGLCPFCFKEINFDRAAAIMECPSCGNPVIPPECVFPICPFCNFVNSVPYPLDSEMNCFKCGASI